MTEERYYKCICEKYNNDELVTARCYGGSSREDALEMYDYWTKNGTGALLLSLPNVSVYHPEWGKVQVEAFYLKERSQSQFSDSPLLKYLNFTLALVIPKEGLEKCWPING